MTIEEAMPATGIAGIIEKTHGAIESAMEFMEDRESPWIPFVTHWMPLPELPERQEDT